MRLVYALSLDVESHQPTHAQVFERAVHIVKAWVDRWHDRRALAATWPDGNGNLLVGKASSGTVEVSPLLPSGLQLWTLTWHHPDESDPTLEWHVTTAVASRESATEFSIQVRLRSTRFQVLPVRFELGTPGVVRDLAGQLRCTVGSSRVIGEASTLTESGVPYLVDELTSMKRRLAVVLVSTEPLSNKPLVDPFQLSRELVGLARVYMADRQSCFALTQLVGKQFSCYNGAVRVYYPQLRLNASPFVHPLYLPDEIERQQALGRNLTKYLLRQLATSAAFRAVEGPLVIEARRELRDLAVAEVDAFIERWRDEAGRKARDEASREARQDLDAALEMAAAVERERTDYEGKIQKLERENAELRDELVLVRRSFYQVSEPADEVPEFRPATPEQAIETVADAVHLAKRSFMDSLVILDSAIRSAEESPYKQPRRVYELLADLAEVTTTWQRAAAGDAGMGKSWKQLVADRGYNWREQISMTSRGKWADDYCFVYKGERRLFQEHVTLGKKQPDSCLSVHCLRDEEERKLVIAHVGRHLTNTKS